MQTADSSPPAPPRRVIRFRLAALLLVWAAIWTGARPAEAVPPRFVADGADLAVFVGQTAPLRFRIQNNTTGAATFNWTITGPSFGASGTARVRALRDTLVVAQTGPLTPIGSRTYTINLVHTVTLEVITATLVVRVVDPITRPSAQTVEDVVVVDLPLQKPITIVTPAAPAPGPGGIESLPEKSASALLPFFVTIVNPDPASPADLFLFAPASGVLSAPPATVINTFVTLSLPPGGLPYGTMNTVRYHIVVAGDTVVTSGQAIFQGACANSHPSCAPDAGPVLWSVSTYDDYAFVGEQSSLWCGLLADPSYHSLPGYGPCWDASAYLHLGTQPLFSAAGGMTLGGVQLYAAELAHDMCQVEIGTGTTPLTVADWRIVSAISGISSPDTVLCGAWPTAPYLCAEYEPFTIVVAGQDVPDNTSLPLWVRWRFRSDLLYDDRGSLPAADTDGAWRIDHVSVRGDLAPSSYYPPDPLRLAVETFEAFPPMWSFPPGTVYDCTGLPEEEIPREAATGPRIESLQPNPSPGRVRLRFAAPAGEAAGAAVFDVSGRLVRELGFAAPGETAETTWDGRARDGSPAAAGVYLVLVRSGARVEARRLVLIPR